MSVWDGVAVSPMESVYEKPEDKKDGEEQEDMEAAEAEADDLME